MSGGPEGHSREERSDNKPRGDDSPFIYLISVSADRSESHTHCSFFFRAFSRKNKGKGEKKRCKGVDKAMRWIMHGIRIIVVVISSFGSDHPLFRGNHQETIIISISDVNHPYLTTARQII